MPGGKVTNNSNGPVWVVQNDVTENGSPLAYVLPAKTTTSDKFDIDGVKSMGRPITGYDPVKQQVVSHKSWWKLSGKKDGFKAILASAQAIISEVNGELMIEDVRKTQNSKNKNGATMLMPNRFPAGAPPTEVLLYPLIFAVSEEEFDVIDANKVKHGVVFMHKQLPK